MFEPTADEALFGADLEFDDVVLLTDIVRGDESMSTVELSKGLLDRSPKKNWVEKAGGLPSYIEKIANALHTEKGMDISRAISVAVGRVKKWAAGGGDVDADTRAKAAKAVAEWEALKAKNKARKKSD